MRLIEVKPASRLSTLARLLPIVSNWRAASALVCDMTVGDGGPDGPVSSEFDLEWTGARSSPNEIEVMESSLTARIGELGLSGVLAGAVLFATAVGGPRLVLMCAGRRDLEKPCAS